MAGLLRAVTRAVKVVALGSIVLLLATAAFGGVTLDVKDEDVHAILKSMQKQCAIKNLAIDPQVQGKATFYLRSMPCASAFDVVLRTFGLRAVNYSTSLTAVERRP